MSLDPRLTDIIEALRPVEKLTKTQKADEFDCGNEPHNRFLKRFSLINQKSGGAQTYVACRGENRIVGYYNLAVGSVDYNEAPVRVVKGHRNQQHLDCLKDPFGFTH